MTYNEAKEIIECFTGILHQDELDLNIYNIQNIIEYAKYLLQNYENIDDKNL